MFMCVSRVCFRAVSSGNAVIAVLRLAVLEETSLAICQHRHPVVAAKLTSGRHRLHR